MIKRFVGCGGLETEGKGRVCVWGEYCVSEGKGEQRRVVRLMGGRNDVLPGGSTLRECILVNSWYQKR